MRGKKCKQLLSWLLCACLMMGLLPVSAFAADTGQQSESTLVGQEDETDGSSTGEDSQTEQQTTNDSVQPDNPATSENKTVSENEEEDQKSNDTARPEEKPEEQAQIATQDAGGAKVVAAKLLTSKTEPEKDVWGTGIITGTGDMDKVSWDKSTDTNRGYDSASDNDIIRSFDSIKYNVSASIQLDAGESHTLVCEVTLPDDNELTLDESAMSTAKEITCQNNGDGTKTYICKYEVEKDYAGGEKEEVIVVKVGNKKQGYTITPTIKAYLDADAANAVEVANMQTVTVTTAPMYNIVLKKRNGEEMVKDVYGFNQTNTADKTYYPDNAAGYQDGNVTGYRCTYGFALEIRKPDTTGGIKGVELPDPEQNFTFDIDLSGATLNDKGLADNGFGPLLYYLGPNEVGGGAVTEIPFTKVPAQDQFKEMGCYNSGNVSMIQDGTTLHVTVNGFGIDAAKYPKRAYASSSQYWEDINKIREGVFSSFQFQVIYPYINANGDKLPEKLGDGTVNVSAVVNNMNAVSTTGTTTTIESNKNDKGEDADNNQANSWSLESGNKRNQQIYYSSREGSDGIMTPYSEGQSRADGDIAPLGADDVAFTVAYADNNVGKADERANLPVAIDQLVLFDSSALKDVEYAKYMQQGVNTGDGYTCSVRYAVLKNGGHLDNESMRTASMDDFDFYDEKPEGGCDAVLVQYRGANLGKATMALYTQFNAKVDKDVNVAENVYMITAFTKVWTASDFKDEILKSTGKDDLEKVTREEISAWGKTYEGKAAAELVKDKELTVPVIDHRDYYTVPTYTDGAYNVDGNHKFSVDSADGLYIVPYTTTVTKTVAQTDEKGDPLSTYNIGQDQRYVDYKISSSMKYAADVKPVKGSTTTVYYEDTIPKGLTYIPNSAYWGGTYTSQYPKAGKVDGGQQIEPEVREENGKTILKWSIPNVALQNDQLPTIYYSCKISNDVADNANLKNEVTIQTDEDKRPILTKNYNVSTAGISVVREKAFYIVKRGGDHLELQDNSYYELVVSNTSSEDKTDLCLFDTMPNEMDGKSKQFNGQYKITALGWYKKVIASNGEEL